MKVKLIDKKSGKTIKTYPDISAIEIGNNYFVLKLKSTGLIFPLSQNDFEVIEDNENE